MQCKKDYYIKLIIILGLKSNNKEFLNKLATSEPDMKKNLNELIEDKYITKNPTGYKLNETEDYLNDYLIEANEKEITIFDIKEIAKNITVEFKNDDDKTIKYNIYDEPYINKELLKNSKNIDMTKLYQIVKGMIHSYKELNNDKIPKISTVIKNIEKYDYFSNIYKKIILREKHKNRYDKYIDRIYK